MLESKVMMEGIERPGGTTGGEEGEAGVVKKEVVPRISSGRTEEKEESGEVEGDGGEDEEERKSQAWMTQAICTKSLQYRGSRIDCRRSNDRRRANVESSSASVSRGTSEAPVAAAKGGSGGALARFFMRAAGRKAEMFLDNGRGLVILDDSGR